MNEVLTRKAAPIVKCPHCTKWIGSARGLFTHVRMAHPGINTKPPISKNEHPYDIRGGKSTIERVNGGFLVHKSPQKVAPITKKEREDFITAAVLVPLFIHIFSQPNIKEILTSEGVNPKRLVVALGKI